MSPTNRIVSAFGPHLMLDGYGCPYDMLTDLDRLYEFLDSMPDKMDMTKIMPPYTFKYAGKVPEDWGLSGFVLIAESHISVHTFPEKGFITVDAFSCKDFDIDRFESLTKQAFGIERAAVVVQSRGLEFPRDTKVVTRHLKRERKALYA